MKKFRPDEFLIWLRDFDILCNQSFDKGICAHCFMPREMRLTTTRTSDPYNLIGLFPFHGGHP